MGLDVALDPSARLMEKHLERFPKEGRLGSFIHSLMAFFVERERGAAALYDPMAVAAAIDKGLFQVRRLPVEVETREGITRGMTIADRRPDWEVEMRMEKALPLIDVCAAVDGDGFLRLFLERMREMVSKAS